MKWIKKHKLISSILLLLIILVLIFVISITAGKGSNPFTSALNGGNSSVSGVLSSFGGNLRDGIEGFISNKDLKSRIDKLEEEKADLERQLAEAKLEAGQLQQLSELSGLLNYDYTKEQFNVVSCDISLRDNSSWTGVFTIDRGEEAGIREESVVISGVGLVGKVCEVGKGWAKVRPIISENNKMSFKLIRDEAQLGIVSGNSKGGFEGYMFDPESSVAESDIVVTSGMGAYPEGLEIGKVTSVIYNSDRLIKEIVVEPAVNFISLRKVAVII